MGLVSRVCPALMSRLCPECNRNDMPINGPQMAQDWGLFSQAP